TRIMKDKNIPPLDFMIHMAKYDGIKFIACQMSMDMLGIKKEDLMDDIEIGGVATMLERARFANMNFFI
ncbi:MAG: DsrE/DsrF/DrsH-like family protein, partial [Bacteroidales bacterium]